MTSTETRSFDELITAIEGQLSPANVPALTSTLAPLNANRVIDVIERFNERDRAVLYRVLPKDRALEVFEGLAPTLQSDLVRALQNAEVAAIFADMDPDDRVGLIDELPASVAARLMQGLPRKERELTAEVLGYPQDSIGRRMSPEYVTTHPDRTAAESLERIQSRLHDAETVYTIPVVERGRKLVGIVSLRDLMKAEPQTLVSEIMQEPQSALATLDEEQAARRCADSRLLALPVVDNESRLVGILTVDDALTILEEEESEDTARLGGVEPLRRPYLSMPIVGIVRSRVVWLLVLAIGATLTVQVLSVFEETLEQMVVLALFIPLLIGTGGNTGNQAATTVTRALALQDVRPRDALRVLGREVRVGALLGFLLGALGFAVAAIVFEPQIGLVIGLTLFAICTMAASLGGLMPLVGRAIRADPAVFSNPFITTFVDATGLIVYFVIAAAVLGL